MKIAIEGCAHGELEKIYETVSFLEKKQNIKVDLLICCGDFQSTRNSQDLECMAVPPKYRSICTFYKYYSGEKEAPVLTLFIGGNHEASNYLSELAYGGWVAPNIYYMGYAGVVKVAGIRIAGLSGIYKGRDYRSGHFEKAPFSENSKRSVYHIRNLEVFRLKQLSGKIDIALSHDWPRGVYHHGNMRQLLKFKPFLQEDIKSNSLGSEPAQELLHHLKPTYWFSAHLHCKFSALIHHIAEDGSSSESTKFLALDKCLPQRRFLQVLDVPHDEESEISLEYDLEWLAILSLTNHLLSVKNTASYMPGPGCDGRWKFTPTKEEQDFVLNRLQGNLKVPLNFSPTVQAYSESSQSGRTVPQPSAQLNPQTMAFCDQLGIDDPISLLLQAEGSLVSSSSAPSLGNVIHPINKAPTKDVAMEPENDTSDTSSSTSIMSKPTLQGMKLPSPKLSSGSLPGFDLPAPRHSDAEPRGWTDAEKLQDDTSDRKHDITESEPSADNPIIESRTPASSDVNRENENQGPLAKKFKRRNQAFYTSQDEDDSF